MSLQLVAIGLVAGLFSALFGPLPGSLARARRAIPGKARPRDGNVLQSSGGSNP